ncbi:fimbrial biogenesis chaperone [Vibrio parahaemolyticus]|uniref:hypothetical protein n=1 Tax=Vibrio parahaemolyticus TaxID=670 RepID=UPI0038918A60
MNKTIMASFLSAGALMSSMAQASVGSIGIDAMIKFADQGAATFSVTNSADYRQFIQVAITELQVTQEGDMTKVPYTRDNIEQWRLAVRPARTIIDPGLQKEFGVQYTGDIESLTQDQAFQLTFVPTPYFAKGDEQKSTVQLAVGFAPVLIVPAKDDQPLSYTVARNEKTVTFNNTGETYFRALLDACPANTKGKAREACMKTVYVLGGRELTVELPQAMQEAPRIKARLSTHNTTYRQSFTLNEGETVTQSAVTQ